MEMIYISLIGFLFLLAIFDLVVGVSNDAVNFLNSAIGAKVARFRTILIIASIGVFIGATLSNGMMDIARHGIFQPQMFSFNDLLCIFLAVMVTDVVLLDVFNTLGMPTSTTVSMVFELLGGTFVLSLLKIVSDPTGMLTFAELLNTDKALSVILGIFLSVAIAFLFGSVVQWLSRLIFKFNYKKGLTWKIGLFGGVAVTSIIYFALLKGLKDSAFMTPDLKHYIKDNTLYIVGVTFVVSTVLMQILHFCKVNVFKIVIFLGTFALALAFAGNDLVNFVGVPLAALSAYQDFSVNGNGMADTYLMSSLNESAKTPFIYLFLSGIVMVIALATSKKAQNVVKTSVDLARQDEGEEMFGSSKVARSIVRGANNVNAFFAKYMPKPIARWINSRFNKEDAIMEEGAAFDLVRASVNLVLSGLLIALGTSLKLPLSTTYVTFIVAMGSSLADRAWSRESAVFRITGVLNVIGGWFITAGVAFSACAVVCLAMYYGGVVVMALFVFLSVFILIRSNFSHQKSEDHDYEDQVFKDMMSTKDKEECWDILKKHVCLTQQEMLDGMWKYYDEVVNGFVDEDLRTLRKAGKHLHSLKTRRKKMRQREMLGMRRIERSLSLEKNTWFHLLSNSGDQMRYCLKRILDPCMEHIDNNFNPLSQQHIQEVLPVKKRIADYLMRSEQIIEDGEIDHIDSILAELENYKLELSQLRKVQEDRLQITDKTEMKVLLVYLNLLQETQELISYLRHYLRAYKRFQQ